MAVASNKQAAQPARRAAAGEAPDAAAAVPEFNKDQELAAYRHMLLIRRFEEKAGQLYGMGLIGGFCHLYIGQEAVVVGMQMAIAEGDQVITGYRDHGHMLACNMEARGVMDWVQDALAVEVVDGEGTGHLSSDKDQGAVLVEHEWRCLEEMGDTNQQSFVWRESYCLNDNRNKSEDN
jgi:TPP-dependent pyruvate/acetoin dehydrogenase alpha subunit